MQSASRFAFFPVIQLRQATGSRPFMGSKRAQNPHDYTEYIIPFLLYICQFEHTCLNPLHCNASRLFLYVRETPSPKWYVRDGSFCSIFHSIMKTHPAQIFAGCKYYLKLYGLLCFNAGHLGFLLFLVPAIINRTFLVFFSTLYTIRPHVFFCPVFDFSVNLLFAYYNSSILYIFNVPYENNSIHLCFVISVSINCEFSGFS